MATKKFTSFLNHYKLEVLLHLTRLDYVGTSESGPDSHCSISKLTSMIHDSKMAPIDPAGPSAPDELFHHFSNLAALLPEATSSWGITLAHQYHSALSEDLHDSLDYDDSYILPDAAELTTKQA